MRINGYKVVRNKVPALFEVHHGEAPDTIESEALVNSRTRMLKKVKEEVSEVAEELEGGCINLDTLYEEIADTITALEGLAYSCYANRGSYEEAMIKLYETKSDKDLRHGNFSKFKVMRITEEQRQHYYNNIKGKIENEY